MKATLTFSPSDDTEYLGKLDADPSTSGWGTDEEGTTWYNTTDHKYKLWNGSEIVLMG